MPSALRTVRCRSDRTFQLQDAQGRAAHSNRTQRARPLHLGDRDTCVTVPRRLARGKARTQPPMCVCVRVRACVWVGACAHSVGDREYGCLGTLSSAAAHTRPYSSLRRSCVHVAAVGSAAAQCSGSRAWAHCWSGARDGLLAAIASECFAAYSAQLMATANGQSSHCGGHCRSHSAAVSWRAAVNAYSQTEYSTSTVPIGCAEDRKLRCAAPV